jgi:YVTN family beta-propeller protein
MRTRFALAVLLAAAAACATTPRPVRVPPLRGEAEVSVFLMPLAREAERLSFTLESVSLRRKDGGEVPLLVDERTIRGADRSRQRRLATGRVPPGDYTAILLKAGSATLANEDERARLLTAAEPAVVELDIPADRGAAAVVWLTLKPAESVLADHSFSPAFSAALPPQTPPQIALYCTDTGASAVTVIDRRSRLVTGSVPVGEVPRGIVINRVGSRAWVALGAEDQIQELDVASNATIDRIRLTPGDGPRELALADASTLLILNERSRTVSFFDVDGRTELGRVPTGDGPVTLLLDRTGRRAYVVNRASATITVIDVATRTVVATLATDPEPLHVQLSRDESRLYVVHRGSAYMIIFALPSLTPQARAYVALGVTTLKVDPRTDLLYLSRGDERRVSVYDPLSFQPVDQFDLPGGASYMAIDDAENTLLALMPAQRAIAVVDLTSRKVLAELPVGAEPYSVALVGERF